MMFTSCGYPSTEAYCTAFPTWNLRTLRHSSSELSKFMEVAHAQNIARDKGGGFRFKLRGLSKVVNFSPKNVNKGKRKNYGGSLPSILKALEAENDLVKALELHCQNLSPKEQTVILKEQTRWENTLKVFEWFKSQKDYISSVIHYNVVLRALGRAQRWDELRLCWIDMEKNQVFPTNNTYGMLVDVYGKAGLVKEALLWIKHMQSRGIYPDEVTMSTVVKVLKDAKDYDRADRFYKCWCSGKIEQEDLGLDSLGDQQSISFKQFLSTELFRSGARSYSLGISVNGDDKSERIPRLASTYNTLIDLYGKAGRLKDATDVFASMLKAGVELDNFTFNTMIHICGKQGSLSEAEALLDKMEERGIAPDTKTYNTFISLYADAGNVDAALRCYRKISKLGLSPDDVTFRAILKILCERNMVQEVEDLIQELEHSGNCIDESSLPLLAKMYLDEGLAERAKLLIEKFRVELRLSSRIYAAIMDLYVEKGLSSEAEALFIIKRDGSGNGVLEYNVMIKAYGKSKNYQNALELFRGMRNRGLWPDECTYNSLIQMLAGADLTDNSKDILAEMQEAGFIPSCSTFSAIISSFAKQKKLSDAVDVFREMLSTGVKPNEVTYGVLINALVEDGNTEEAMKYFRAMEHAGISANHVILTSMIKAYGKIGSVEGAKQMYEKMEELHGGPDVVASNSMINLYGENGMVSEAEAIYDDLIRNDSADSSTFATMMDVYKNMGMLDEAIQIATKMKRSGLLDNSGSFNKVMACYATKGLLVECGELLHEFLVEKKLSPDAGTFKVLFTVLKKGGFPRKAVKELESSLWDGKPFAKQATITSVFSILGLHSYALESCGIFKKGHSTGAIDASAYNAAIRAYTAYGKIDQALNMFMKMQGEGLEPDIVTLISLVKCYGKASMIEGIKRIQSQMKYGAIEVNESLYRAIIDAYRIANRNDLAEMAAQEMRLASETQETIEAQEV